MAALVKTRFEYLRASSVPEAVEMLAAHGTGARYLAGGTDLYLDWKNGSALERCIDISHLGELDYLHVEDSVLRIGALTSLRSLEHSAATDYASRALACLARVMCTPQTRTLATVGGNLCNASPAADLAPLLLCLDAELAVVGRDGPRVVPIIDLWSGPKRTTLDPSELVVEVSVRLRPHSAVAVRRATRTALDIALVIVAVLVSTNDDGVIDTARIGLGSVAPSPLRAREAEAVLLGLRPADVDSQLSFNVAAQAAPCASPIDDMRTSAAYRRSAIGTLVSRATQDALTELAEEKGNR